MIEANRKARIQHWKVIAVGLMIYDAAAIAFSYFFGLWLRFDFQFTSIDTEYLDAYAHFILFYIVASIVFFWFMRMYRAVWRFVGFNDLLRYASASVFASVIHAIVITLVCHRMPFSYYIVGGVVQLILVVGMRFSYRFYTQVVVAKAPEFGASPGEARHDYRRRRGRKNRSPGAAAVGQDEHRPGLHH